MQNSWEAVNKKTETSPTFFLLAPEPPNLPHFESQNEAAASFSNANFLQLPKACFAYVANERSL